MSKGLLERVAFGYEAVMGVKPRLAFVVSQGRRDNNGRRMPSSVIQKCARAILWRRPALAPFQTGQGHVAVNALGLVKPRPGPASQAHSSESRSLVEAESRRRARASDAARPPPSRPRNREHRKRWDHHHRRPAPLS